MPSSPNYNDNQFVVGPADIWINVTPPVSGTLLTLEAATGYPPDGQGLGYQEEGITVTVAWERAPEESDPQFLVNPLDTTLPVTWPEVKQNDLRLWSITQLAFGGRLVQARSMDLLEQILTAGTRSVALMTFGQSKPPVARKSALVVWRVYPAGEEPTPTWGYCMIYAANNRSDFLLGLKSNAQAGLDFIYEAEPVFTRPYADRLGQLYMG